jgi:hypothetical protein
MSPRWPPGGRRADAAPGGVAASGAVSLQRAAWLVTVLGFLAAALLLVLAGYQGYAALSGAVALCAAVNLR